MERISFSPSIVLMIVVGAVMALDPEILHAMVTESTGQLLLACAGLAITLGYVIMMRIAKVDD
jgi:Flp pilus assembly protein TadB